MKHFQLCFILITIIFSSSFVSEFSSANPIPLINTKTVSVSLFDIKQKAIFKKAHFNQKMQNLEFETNNKIKFIQIFTSEGKLKYQLPVMSTKVKISKKMFAVGAYVVGFKLYGMDKIQFTELKIRI